MEKQNKNTNPNLAKLKELSDKVKRAIKRSEALLAVDDKKYIQELADYEMLYGKYEGD